MDWHKRYVQQAAWTKELRTYLFDRAALASAHLVLEVGCGTGALLSDLVTPVGLHGLDLQLSSLEQAHQHAPRAILTCGNALWLPFAGAVFDITFCHFLLLWVRDPLQALQEMKRVTRSGGYILAMAEPDYIHRIDKPAALAPLGLWQAEALKRQGADPGIGKRLAQTFNLAGIHLIETGALNTAGRHPPSLAQRELEWEVLEADLAGSVPEQKIQQLKMLDEGAWQRGERVLNVPTYWAFGMIN